ncbi:hypothetical protein FRB90_011834, partial [Tulasnella sp. 427]
MSNTLRAPSPGQPTYQYKKARTGPPGMSPVQPKLGVIILPNLHRQQLNTLSRGESSLNEDEGASHQLELKPKGPPCLSELPNITLVSEHSNEGRYGDPGLAVTPDAVEYIIVPDDGSEVLKIKLDARWTTSIQAAFSRISKDNGTPLGLGCVVCSVDDSTVVVLHRTHFEIFGTLRPPSIPPADVLRYIRSIYRPWEATQYVGTEPAQGWNETDERGGPIPWSFDVLETSETMIGRWLERQSAPICPRISIDVVIPSYRVQLPLLRTMLNLKASSTCSVEFIVVVDNPLSPSLPFLLKEFKSRPDVHILINNVNVGASASRNRRLWTSTAEWVHFLDDDVVPSPDLLLESERAIRRHPKAAGFVGNVYFPPP